MISRVKHRRVLKQIYSIPCNKIQFCTLKNFLKQNVLSIINVNNNIIVLNRKNSFAQKTATIYELSER